MRFDTTAYVGCIVLLGIVVNNGIVLVDHVNQYRRRGIPFKEALVTGAEAAVNSVIMEIRAGTGGNEAALFAGDLFAMYQRYCNRRALRLEIISSSAGEVGGFKEAIFSIKGKK